jgi:hypothetical protein
MKVNMGSADRLVRTLIALVIGYLYFTHRITGLLGIILAVFAVIFLATSLFGWCPLYMPFGISTRKQPPGAAKA